MRELRDMQLLKVVVHILNNRDDIIILNDFELDIDSRLEKLFKNHIKNSITDEKTRVACFSKDTPNVVKDLCEGILIDEDQFIPNSKGIANQLYSSMKQHIRIAPANFFVCVYKANEEKYVALLKMDFSEIIETKVETIDGKNKIVLQVKGSGVPNDQQKLRKCVFFKQYNEDDEYNIILLDKDSKEEDVARFFEHAFLNCELIHTNKVNTRNILNNTESFIHTLYAQEPIKARDKIEILVHSLKYHEEMNVVDLANQIFPEENLNKEYLDMISKKVGDFTFEIDKEFVEKKITKKIIHTSNGIDIKVDLDIYEDRDKFDIIKRENEESVDIVIKNVFFEERTAK